MQTPEPYSDLPDYRQTRAAAAPQPQHRAIPYAVFGETVLLLAVGYLLHRHYRPAPWLFTLIPAYAALRCILRPRQDRHCYPFPTTAQRYAAPLLILLTAASAFFCHLTLAALYRAAGGQTAQFAAAILPGALGILFLRALHSQWRTLCKPLLAYQADNHSLILYQWQDYRHIPGKTWPVENFRGIALHKLPIEHGQLLLLGKNGQPDILIEEGGETYLRQRQQLLARSSGMAMLET